jgi:ABC-type branched-subunit amino acid transport system substrate-binding protein
MPKTISQHKATETMKSLRKAIFASLLALGICQAHAEDGVTDSSITLGMSAPFSGPNGLYGMQMREAMTAYFDQVNKEAASTAARSN